MNYPFTILAPPDLGIEDRRKEVRKRQKMDIRKEMVGVFCKASRFN